ncbi:tetratricopeptide repeat protein [Polycladidibacter stylochi]|uniref:DUF2659 family protein n=1 Tax=Polycladidibacter stylochi TaxID=1807766 RepID=UPI000836D1DA|nr:tetratricopeptide repeat protein [Pseudovibrio stylochi]
MSDIFREVDEDVRTEQYARLWKRFAPFVYLAAALIILGTAGYKGYSYWQQGLSEKAGQTFLEAIELSQAGKHEQARKQLETLQDATGGYPMLAQMRIAAEYSVEGKAEDAIAELNKIAANGDYPTVYRQLANIRAAYLMLDTASTDELKTKLSSELSTGNALHFSAQEVIALSQYKAEKYQDAQKTLTKVVEDATAPSDIVGRARLYLELINSKIGSKT